MRIAVHLHIRSTDARITHDGTSAGGFHFGLSATAAATSVHGMVPAELVSHFVCNIVYVKWVTHGIGSAGITATLLASGTHARDTSRIAASLRIEVVSDVIVGITDLIVNFCLGGIVPFRGPWVRTGIAPIYNEIVVGHKLHSDSQINFVNTIYAVHGNGHRSLNVSEFRSSIGEIVAIFGSTGKRQPESSKDLIIGRSGFESSGNTLVKRCWTGGRSHQTLKRRWIFRNRIPVINNIVLPVFCVRIDIRGTPLTR